MLKPHKLIFIMIFLAMFRIPASSLTLAVLELTSKGIHNIIAYAATDIIRSEFVNIGNFTVVERTKIRSILEEHGLQMTGCTDQDCAIEIGKILSAEKVVVGEVNSLKETVVITIRYIDVNTGISMFSSTGKVENIDDVIKVAESTAGDLIRKIIEGDKEIITPVLPHVYYSVSFIPGCGQLYAGEDTKGWVFLTSFIATGALSAFAIINYNKKRDEYRDLPELPVGSKEYDRKYDSAKKAGYFALGSTILCSLVYAANWIDVLFITKPVFRRVRDASKSLDNVEADIRIFGVDDISLQSVNLDLGFRLRF